MQHPTCLFLDEAGKRHRSPNIRPHLQHGNQTRLPTIKSQPAWHIASTVEHGIAAMLQGYRPIWVINSFADFPLIPAIEALTIIVAHDRQH